MVSRSTSRPHPNSYYEYAEDMKSDIGRWEISQRQPNANWAHHYSDVPAFPHAPAVPSLQLTQGNEQAHYEYANPRVPKTRTTPISTRTKVARHGSQPSTPRPKSSGGDRVLPYRQFGPPKRAESYSQPTPLEEFRKMRRWPPAGYHQDDDINAKDAEDIICAGTSTFKGYGDPIEHAPEGYMRYYAVMDNEHQGRTDRASFRHSSFREISLDTTGAADSQFPWLSLEQPCMVYAFGKSAGTCTLNYWVGKSGSGNPPTKFAGSTKPRKISLLHILDRLQRLKSGLDEVSTSRPPVRLV